ncbi:MAG TPA: tellurium resistance protein TerC, partial [Actinobacteria bacterium]|nr:tellurium resistance protein TerC [Actinomycetota bacterium]
MWVWAATILGVLLLIAFDFFTVSRTPHEVGIGEAARWSIFYIALAVIFGIGVFYFMGSQSGTEFFTAYLVEKSLSVDNLFVFAIILAQFAVPSILQQRVLLIGIVLALIFRAIFIAIGAAALSAFAFTFVLFGALLIWTGIQLARHHNEDPKPADNFMVKVIRRKYAFTDEYHGTAMFIREAGKRVATPMLLVIIAIGSTDL